MRQLKLLIKILLLILFFSSFSIAQKTKIIKPDNAKSKVILEIGGKHIIYHSLQPFALFHDDIRVFLS